MTRRQFISTAGAAVIPCSATIPLIVPVRLVMDSRAKSTPAQVRRFSASIWPEAVRDFKGGGIELQSTQVTGAVGRSPGDRPVFTGLDPGTINFVITDHIPMKWAQGKGLAGVSTQYDGYRLSMVALDYAHGDQIPFVSVNTCVHELLHVLLQDIFEVRPKGLADYEREIRIDWLATRLWIFHDGSAVRAAAYAYLNRKQDVKIL